MLFLTFHKFETWHRLWLSQMSHYVNNYYILNNYYNPKVFRTASIKGRSLLWLILFSCHMHVFVYVFKFALCVPKLQNVIKALKCFIDSSINEDSNIDLTTPNIVIHKQ